MQHNQYTKKSDRGLRPFAYHGVDFQDTSGEEAIGTCPWCEREGKFYVNRYKRLWHCKVCGEGGSLHAFLDKISKLYEREFHHNRRRRLADNRKLPQEAFKGWRIGWNGKAFTFPVADIDGKIVDIRSYKPGRAGVRSTAGCNVGLFGAQHLAERHGERVFLCEGEWDAMALNWLLRHLRKKGVAVGVPGAQSFRTEWIPWFQGRDVYAAYDNDNAGEKGETLADTRLSGSVDSLHFMQWPSGLPEGYDVRDWIAWGIDHDIPRKCYGSFMRNFKTRPRTGFGRPDAEDDDTEEAIEPQTLDQVKATFHKWLELKDSEAIEVMLATVLSHEMLGDPLWMFLVAPPGGAKTEMLNSLGDYQGAYLLSSLTPRTLISGMNQGKIDPSLLPKLDGKILVVKDFTAILTLRDADKDEIFGTLRDAYDGHCRKSFGNGITRSYKSRFTFLAAVTPKIYEVSIHHEALGERFMKYFVGDSLRHYNEEQTIRRAISNAGSEPEMRKEMSRAVRGFFEYFRFPKHMPEITHSLEIKLIALAQFLSRMRGTVVRDAYRSDLVVGRPSREHGTRISKQLLKLAQAVAVLRGKDVIEKPEFEVLQKVALDTATQRRTDVVEFIYRNTRNEHESVTTRELVRKTPYPIGTISRLLADLNILKVVQKAGGRGVWTICPEFRKVIDTCEIFRNKKLLVRVRHGRRLRPGLRIKRKSYFA